MAQAVPIISLALSAFGAVQQYKSGEAAEEAAKENDRNIRMENEEEARRQSIQNAKQEAEARARAAASGVTLSGSTADYLNEMESENAKQLTWLRKSGVSRGKVARKEGEVASSGAYAGALGSLGSTAMNAYNWYDS